MRAASGLHPRDAFGRQGALADEELSVLGAIDVVGDDRHGQAFAQPLAELQAEHRFAGAYGATDTDAGRAVESHVFSGDEHPCVGVAVARGGDIKPRVEPADFILGHSAGRRDERGRARQHFDE